MKKDTKLSKLKEAFYNEDYEEAVSIAAKFPRLGAERDDILTAHECFKRPRIYKQMGRDVEELKKKGIEALRHKYDL